MNKAKTCLRLLWVIEGKLRISTLISRTCVERQTKSLQECSLNIEELAASLREEDIGGSLELGGGGPVDG